MTTVVILEITCKVWLTNLQLLACLRLVIPAFIRLISSIRITRVIKLLGILLLTARLLALFPVAAFVRVIKFFNHQGC